MRHGPRIITTRTCAGCAYHTTTEEATGQNDGWDYLHHCEHVDAPSQTRNRYSASTPDECPFLVDPLSAWKEEQR